MVPRMLTVTTRDINEIMRYKEMLFALYEVYGKSIYTVAYIQCAEKETMCITVISIKFLLENRFLLALKLS